MKSDRQKGAQAWRRLLLLLLLAAFAWLGLTRRAVVIATLSTLARGQWQWVALALLLQVLFYLLYAGLYQAAFSAVDIKARLLRLLPLLFSSVFINTVAPSLGASGAVLFVEDAASHGESPARAAAAMVLVPVADATAFSVLLVAGMAYLFYQRSLHAYEVASAVILLLLNLGLTLLLLLGLSRPGALQSLLHWLQQTVNTAWQRLRHRPLLAQGWAERNASDFARAAQAIRDNGRSLLRALGLAGAANLANLASLYALFLAFHQPVAFGVLVAGFAIGVALSLVAITPQGVGVVEGGMALAYTSLGIPGPVAAAVVLGFRGLNVGLPVLAGFLLLRRNRLFARRR